MKLLERIRKAIASGKVEYWENRPQHLTRADLDEVFLVVPRTYLSSKWRQEKAAEGNTAWTEKITSTRVSFRSLALVVPGFCILSFFLEKGRPARGAGY